MGVVVVEVLEEPIFRRGVDMMEVDVELEERGVRDGIDVSSERILAETQG